MLTDYTMSDIINELRSVNTIYNSTKSSTIYTVIHTAQFETES